ncbi:MAG: L,D-transpeptidase family protein [Anaerolineales bacterium]|jgi:hypothetical protein
MQNNLTRRDFLKLSGLSTAALAFRPMPPGRGGRPIGLARVATSFIGLYTEPSFSAKRLVRYRRDALITLLARERSDDGPRHNPVWYRIGDGYVHSGSLQLVRWEVQSPREDIPEGGALFEVSVPYTRAYVEPDPTSRRLYRLYYQSTAWVNALVRDSLGRCWYRVYSHRLGVHYHVRSEHLRKIPPEEYSPLSPDVPLEAKRIEVSVASQEMMAYEHNRLVFRTRISSGIPDKRPGINGVPLATPEGVFAITKKTPVRHMGDGHLTDDLDAYELPGVPWVAFFHKTGVAFHGTYWHTDFGRPKSHGCVNMQTDEARWLFRWTMPTLDPGDHLRTGLGTRVFVY